MIPDEIKEWLVSMGATPFELVFVVVGILSAMAIWSIRNRDKKTMCAMRRDIKENNRLYHQVDKLQFGTAKAIQAKYPEIKLINESADGVGDHSLDRSV
jgi:hypothetical protein